MLAADEKRLRWLGVDMRPRWRRRVAVMLTYTVFVLVAGWSYIRGDWAGVWLMWIFVISFSPLKRFGLVEGAGRVSGWVAWLVRRFGGWAAERSLARGRVPMKLEMVAVRCFERRFEELSTAEKDEALGNFRALMRGEEVPEELRLMQRGGLVDERLVEEEDRLNAMALRVVTWVLLALVFTWFVWRERVRLNGPAVLLLVAGLHLLASTLPRAMALWGERDPREVGGEMELVEREA